MTLTRTPVDATVTQTQLHRATGKLLSRFRATGGLIEITDRWDRVVAVLVIGPRMEDVTGYHRAGHEAAHKT